MALRLAGLGLACALIGCSPGTVDQDALVAQVAAANPNTVVVLDTGGPVLMPWLNQVKGLFEAWYPGQEDGNAIAALLFGDVDPSARLTETFLSKTFLLPMVIFIATVMGMIYQLNFNHSDSGSGSSSSRSGGYSGSKK